MCYPLSDSDNQLSSLPSVSPERPSPDSTPPPPPPPSDPDLSFQETNSPAHSTPSTPEGQAASKRVRTDASESEHSDENQPSTSDEAAPPPPATVQQTIL